MSKLEAAAARLKAALDSLEKAVSSSPGAGSDGAKKTGLRKERDALLARVAELEDERRSLASINEDIGARLDGTIEDVRAVLGQ